MEYEVNKFFNYAELPVGKLTILEDKIPLHLLKYIRIVPIAERLQTGEIKVLSFSIVFNDKYYQKMHIMDRIAYIIHRAFSSWKK